jgi:hypothetical protein
MIAAPRFLGRFKRDSAARGEPYPSWDFPALEDKYLEGAKLFADRKDLITSLPLAPGGAIAEIGVERAIFRNSCCRRCGRRVLSPSTFSRCTMSGRAAEDGRSPIIRSSTVADLPPAAIRSPEPIQNYAAGAKPSATSHCSAFP